MPNRYQSLDALRGALAWIVVLVHVAYFLHVRNWATYAAGVWAVDGFVILSGFVIAKLLFAKKETFARFIFRRAMRLYPVYLVILAWSVGLHFMLKSSPMPGMIAFEDQYFGRSLLEHLTLSHSLFNDPWLREFAFLPPAWSVSLEWQLYLGAVPLLLAMNRFRGPFVAAGLAITGALFLYSPWNDGFILSRLFFFFIGMSVAMYEPFLPRLWTTSTTFPRPLLLLGEWSYSTYLCHWPVLAVITACLPADWPTKAKACVLVGVGFPLIAGLSFALYELIERPGIAFGKSFTFRKRNPSSDAERIYIS